MFRIADTKEGFDPMVQYFDRRGNVGMMSVDRKEELWLCSSDFQRFAQ
jgi:hypothetical protein